MFLSFLSFNLIGRYFNNVSKTSKSLSIIFNRSSFSSNVLTDIPKDYPLYQAGARKGDKIVKINNTSIKNFDDVELAIAINGEGKPIDITIQKKNNKQLIHFMLKNIPLKHNFNI